MFSPSARCVFLSVFFCMFAASTYTQNPAANWEVVGAGDFNRDGKTDLVVQSLSTRQISILTMNRTVITGSIPVNPTLPANWKVVGVGDYSDDGYPDLLVQNTAGRRLSALIMNGAVLTSSVPITPTLPDGWFVVGPK